MRKIKYLRHTMRLAIIVLWGITMYYFEDLAIYSLLVMIFLDLLLEKSVFSWLKKKIEKKELVHLNHGYKSGIVIGTTGFILMFLVIIYPIYSSTTINLNLIGVIAIAHFTLADILFSEYRKGFILDKIGIVQPEIFNKNFIWKKVNDIEISESEMSMSIHSKKYNSDISQKERNKIIRLLTDIGVRHGA